LFSVVAGSAFLDPSPVSLFLASSIISDATLLPIPVAAPVPINFTIFTNLCFAEKKILKVKQKGY